MVLWSGELQPADFFVTGKRMFVPAWRTFVTLIELLQEVRLPFDPAVPSIKAWRSLGEGSSISSVSRY